MISRAKAQEHLEGALQDQLSLLLRNFCSNIVGQRFDKASVEYESGYRTLLKAYRFAEDLLNSTIQEP